MRRSALILVLAAQIAAAQGRGAGAAAATRRIGRPRRRHPRELLEVRVPHRHARRHQAVHVGLRAQGRFLGRQDVSHPDGADGLQRRALWHRPVPRQPRPLGAVRAREVHLRLPGRARPVHERRRLRHHPPAQAGQERAQGHRREHRHLRHHRLAGEARPRQHRQGGDVGHLAAGVLRHGGDDRRASGAGGGVAAGARHRLLHGRRRLPQRRVHAGAPLRLLHGVPQSRGRPRAAPAHAAVRLRHARRLRFLSSAWVRWPTPTRSISSTSSPCGT